MSAQTEPSTNTQLTTQNGKKKKLNRKREDEQENSVGALLNNMLENGQLTSKLYEQMGSANEYLNEHTSLQVLVYGTFLLGLIPTIMFGVYIFSTFTALLGAVFLSFCVLQGIIFGFGLAILIPVLLSCFGIMLSLVSAYYFGRYAYQVGCRVQYWLENTIQPPTYQTSRYPIDGNHRTIQHAAVISEEEQPLSEP
ncbi:hypothetical protein K493DRAFT_316160 [Basidiobolus meristosporus CBS 931.73]|uniref:Uncharacterized protein n=1 Tax=Basidiobolus meristosporus CBS 931.73 TaxID=1314790 RepID=A0A1Y1Y582_9FUNG|nr:hypothetical protein K493DRAFT_316160 [Basidiobolus meristosporus CBS 931.73]|eukprot:ORX93109.1 hypothetical protein K493DRAFT_316160 [Basidiobolus meristosporus CBS 931.73]